MVTPILDLEVVVYVYDTSAEDWNIGREEETLKSLNSQTHYQ